MIQGFGRNPGVEVVQVQFQGLILNVRVEEAVTLMRVKRGWRVVLHCCGVVAASAVMRRVVMSRPMVMMASTEFPDMTALLHSVGDGRWGQRRRSRSRSRSR